RVPIDVAPQHDVLERRSMARRSRSQRLPSIVHVLVEKSSEPAQDVLRTPRVFGHHHDVEGRTVLDQQLAAAVVDQTAGRIDAFQTYAVVLGKRAKVLALDDLKLPQAHDQKREREDDETHGDGESALKSVGGLARARQWNRWIVHGTDS